MFTLIKKLADGETLTRNELESLIKNHDPEAEAYLLRLAHETTLLHFGNKIFIRGLIEFTNICKNDCFYCGLRVSNTNVERYRLTKEEILDCCAQGYTAGFRTFVLQGGEDEFFTDVILCDIIQTIKTSYPDCAITLSVGERTLESYQKLFLAGANRYLLRHETANPYHYTQLHPRNLSLENRKNCLEQIKNIGYQVGTGFLVGSPYQLPDYLAEDLLFVQELQPQMIGIGPFIPHHDTPFRHQKAGTMEMTTHLIAILRLMLPKALIPATTALNTIDPHGRQNGILAGANVVMPNLSPSANRANYLLYDNKLCTGLEAAEQLAALKQELAAFGYEIVVDRGDFKA